MLRFLEVMVRKEDKCSMFGVQTEMVWTCMRRSSDRMMLRRDLPGRRPRRRWKPGYKEVVRGKFALFAYSSPSGHLRLQL